MTQDRTVTSAEVSTNDDVVGAHDPRSPLPTEQPGTGKSTSRQQRKRTKTGCLTCRKRRIKCDEVHPVCNNCVKSKRNCEGYSQRVVFKTPIGAYYGPGQGYALYEVPPSSAGGGAQVAGSGSRLLPIAPKVLLPPSHHYLQSPTLGPQSQLWPMNPPSHGTQRTLVGVQSYQNIAATQIGYDYHSAARAPTAPFVQYEVSNSDALPPRADQQQQRLPSTEDWHYVTPPMTSAENGKAIPLEAIHDIHPQLHKVGPDVVSRLPFYEEEEDDPEDPWDVMDESLDDPPVQPIRIENLQLLSRVNAPQTILRVRSYHTFLNEPNILARYRPRYTSSPLTDEKTARIFAHFITATGQSITIFERNYGNTSAVFGSIPVPSEKQALWTYTLPALALENPPLMHAILALGALHISKLQDTSIGPSTKHFHYALRRVGKLIGLPEKRNEIATLAANLLLGFYEVMCAEHSKWNIHLSGAKILVMEIDFASMTRTIRRMRERAKATIATMSPPPDMLWRDLWKNTGCPENLTDGRDWEIDDRFVAELSGMHVGYYGSPLTEAYETPYMTEKDIDEYKTRSDLFWWFCKQDVFQSMISGNPLLMPYEHWITNPPRAQFGRIDAAYGTFDQLVLLMARLTDFGAKDRRRKMKALAANGGQWRPPPAYFPSRPSRQGMPQGSGPPPHASGAPPNMGPSGVRPQPRPPMPTFHGMMPPHPARMEAAYATVSNNLQDPYRTDRVSSHDPNKQQQQFTHAEMQGEGNGNIPSHTSSASTATPGAADSKQSELDAWTAQALAEHDSIARAFKLFAESLPPTFAPLTANQSPRIETPFGPAIQYRTHTIACIHVFYQCGLLLLERMNPCMPPAAMMATGIAAFKTADIANTMGRICGSLYHTLGDNTPRMATPQGLQFRASNEAGPATATYTIMPKNDLNPSLGAALMESTFPMFFAAVQYTDAEQRSWTIRRLRDIARCTGWQTSAAVAAGCEAAWQKMGMGQVGSRGPQAHPPQPPTSHSGTQHQQQIFMRGSSDLGAPSSAPDASMSSGPHPVPPTKYPTWIPTVSKQDRDTRIAGLWTLEEQRQLQAEQQSMKSRGNHQVPNSHLRPMGPLWEQANGRAAHMPPTQPWFPTSNGHGPPHIPTHPTGTNRSASGLSSARTTRETPPIPASMPHSYDSQFESPSLSRPVDDSTTTTNTISRSSGLPEDDEIPALINHDRRYIGTNPNARVHWALGILGLEKDLSQLDIGAQGPHQ